MGDVAAIWARDDEGRWRTLGPSGFANEADLHDLIERNPEMLPLAGAPRLAVLGREVACGRGYADLIAVEAETGRPVVIEIKLAANTDRRQVFTQVLGYAAWLRRLDRSQFDRLLAPHLARQKVESIAAAASAAAQDPLFDMDAFQGRLESALEDGRLRCAVVLDSAPDELAELGGYLQEVTNDRLVLDVVTVSAFRVGSEEVMVPQLIEPDSSTWGVGSTALSGKPEGDGPEPGSAEFEIYLSRLPNTLQDKARRLLLWARSMEAAGLTTLHSSVTHNGAILHLRLPRQTRSMVTVWTEGGVRISPYRTVFADSAPTTLDTLDEAFPEEIRQGNWAQPDPPEALLDLIRRAYEEAASPQASSTGTRATSEGEAG